MKPVDFCYWVQGFFEINGRADIGLSADQTNCIRRHLALVFKHEIDPSYGPPEKQAELNKIHAGDIHDQSHINKVYDQHGTLIRC